MLFFGLPDLGHRSFKYQTCIWTQAVCHTLASFPIPVSDRHSWVRGVLLTAQPQISSKDTLGPWSCGRCESGTDRAGQQAADPEKSHCALRLLRQIPHLGGQEGAASDWVRPIHISAASFASHSILIQMLIISIKRLLQQHTE